MDQLERLRTFVAVADQASFAEAARRMQISPTAASRAVAALEASLGTLLFHRTTRSVRLTEDGATYLERCRHALAELEHAALEVRGDRARPGGTMMITAPVVFGRLHVLPVVTRLLRANPPLSIQLTVTDRVVRMAEEGIDVAMRIGELADSTLHALKVAEVRHVLVASPAYLAARGRPTAVAELHAHALISFPGGDRVGEWRFGPNGKPSMRIRPRLGVNSADTAIAAALDGLGIARVLSYQALEAIASGALEMLLDDQGPPAMPVQIVYPASRRTSANVKAFVAEARAYFGEHRLDLGTWSSVSTGAGGGSVVGKPHGRPKRGR